MKPYTLTIALTAGLLATSCSDFLEGKSHDQVIVKTTKDYSELLYGAGYPSDDVLGFTDEMTDDADWIVNQTSDKQQSAADSEQFMTAYCWQPTLYEWGTGVEYTNTSYYMIYSKITGCNAVLDGIDDAIGTQTERDRVKAEALASRALSYFNLVNLYGMPYNYNKESAGVPLKTTADIDEYGQARNSVAEVYDFIEADLIEAIGLMKANALTTVEKNYRINLPAIYTILSRVYLFEERWQDAADMASEALKLSGTIHDLTAEDHTISTDLFSINSYRSDEAYWVYGNCSYSDNKQPSNEFIELFDENDVRYDLENGMYMRGIAQTNPLTWAQEYLGAYSRPKVNGLSSSSSTRTVPSIAIRASEALLNRAEAYAKLNRTGDAFKDVEKIRAKRIRNYTSPDESDITDMLQYVRDERRRELCFEGYRWFDLRRYGMPKVVHSYKITANAVYYVLQEKDPFYTLPIPSSVMELNPELSQNESAFISPRSASTSYQ